MRIRHTVLLVWKDGTTAEQLLRVTTGLDHLRAVLPGLVRYDYGSDLGLDEGNAAFVIVADFDSLDDYVAYRDHPDHQAFIAEMIRPIVASRTAAQYELNP